VQIKEWDQYQNGISYNNRIEPNYYDMVDCNWDFFYGKQWRGANLNPDYPQPVFNNINRFVTFFVAAIMASKPKGQFVAPVVNKDDDTDNIVNACWEEFAEREKLTFKIKRGLYDGAVTGDYVGHMIFNPDAKPYGGNLSDVMGQIELELIDPNNFYMGNANTSDVQSQPYVQIAGRDLIKNLKAEQESQAKIQGIIDDDGDTTQQASYYGDIEMEGEDSKKATYVITYTKKTIKDKETGEKRQTVLASKCTEGAYVYKDVDLGISLYPVALGNWEEQRNTYHGMSFVTYAIPTQIFINRGFASAMYHTLLTTFPKLVYNKAKVSGVMGGAGGQFGVNLAPNESINGVMGYISPGTMSPDVMNMINMAQNFMQETVGANDALLGNINPEQASGISIATTSKQAGIPLENPKTNMYNWIEDLMRIFYDMISNLYGTRPVIVSEGDDQEIIEYNFDELQNVYKSVKIDVGQSSYWSELAVIQTLDNLLDRGLIEFIDYLERMPDGYIVNKNGLIDKIQEQVKGGDTAVMEFMDQLTPEQQQTFQQLPSEEQQKLIEEYKAEEGL